MVTTSEVLVRESWAGRLRHPGLVPLFPDSLTSLLLQGMGLGDRPQVPGTCHLFSLVSLLPLPTQCFPDPAPETLSTPILLSKVQKT